uniref:Reverse transcriptase domain-containing protein n=2 Tax=Scylla olivacea TaxID=85551 RepID=A0A0P4W501_SCYOL
MDGFLQWLHTLVLMDDTILLATTKCNMVRKIALLQDYCEEYGIRINQVKTTFFVIGGKEGDSEALMVIGLTVKHCQTCVYLGSVFTSDGSVSSAVIVHANEQAGELKQIIPSPDSNISKKD